MDFVGSVKVLAHLFEVASLYLIYKAFVEVGLTSPYDLVFRNLKESEDQAPTAVGFNGGGHLWGRSSGPLRFLQSGKPSYPGI